MINNEYIYCTFHVPWQTAYYEPTWVPSSLPNQPVLSEPDLCIPDSLDCTFHNNDQNIPRHPQDRYLLLFGLLLECTNGLDFWHAEKRCEVSLINCNQDL